MFSPTAKANMKKIKQMKITLIHQEMFGPVLELPSPVQLVPGALPS
jgi:hypothetical protein